MKIALSKRPGPHRELGSTLLEVLITIVILAFGLLGLAGLQARMQVAEIEAYQRAEAVMLAQEMVDRINANRKNVANYVTDDLGTGSTMDCSSPGTIAEKDLCEWNNALIGKTEVAGGGTCTSADTSGCRGAMIAARGCISVATLNLNPVFPAGANREVLVSVVWQGLSPTSAPTTTACHSADYTADTRRAVVVRVMIGCLQNDTGGTLCV